MYLYLNYLKEKNRPSGHGNVAFWFLFLGGQLKMELTNDHIMEVIIKRRALLGLTQTELAKKVGVGKQAINNMERGVSRAPSATTLLKICKVLGLNVYDFFEEGL